MTKERGDGIQFMKWKLFDPILKKAPEYDEDLTALDESIERLRLRHEAQFAAMNAAVASLKETEKTLENMMEAWKGGMNK